MEKQKLLTMNQLVEQTQISRVTLWKWLKSGKIPYYQISNSKRFMLDEVLAATKVKN